MIQDDTLAMPIYPLYSCVLMVVWFGLWTHQKYGQSDRFENNFRKQVYISCYFYKDIEKFKLRLRHMKCAPFINISAVLSEKLLLHAAF